MFSALESKDLSCQTLVGGPGDVEPWRKVEKNSFLFLHNYSSHPRRYLLLNKEQQAVLLKYLQKSKGLPSKCKDIAALYSEQKVVLQVDQAELEKKVSELTCRQFRFQRLSLQKGQVAVLFKGTYFSSQLESRCVGEEVLLRKDYSSLVSALSPAVQTALPSHRPSLDKSARSTVSLPRP